MILINLFVSDIHIETVRVEDMQFAYHYHLTDEDIDVNIPMSFFQGMRQPDL